LVAVKKIESVGFLALEVTNSPKNSSKFFAVLFFKCEMLLFLLLILSDQESPRISPNIYFTDGPHSYYLFYCKSIIFNFLAAVRH
jgi:hypothetical protein